MTLISDSDCDVLTAIVTKFLKLNVELYGKNSIRPKFHHLIHYPSAIRNFGPSKYHSTLGNERALGQLKSFVKSPNNPINQIMQGVKFQSLFFLFSLRPDYELEYTTVGTEQVLTSAIVDAIGFCPTNLINDMPEKARIFKQTIYRTCLFAPKLAICINNPSHQSWMQNLPSFYYILLVFAPNSSSLFVLAQKMKTICYDRSYLGYKVLLQQEYVLLNCSDISVRLSFSIHKIGNVYVVLPDGLPYRCLLS